jgi:hypothetical protein
MDILLFLLLVAAIGVFYRKAPNMGGYDHHSNRR